jgi:N-acetylmannosamine-6-phosphate 2-epimerase/N-acetylmannosamine kinase
MAIDIGGTWLRAAFFSPDFALIDQDRIALPATSAERAAWMRKRAETWGLRRISISSGGTIDPITTEVIEAKPIIPDHVGTNFRMQLSGHEVSAMNDGLATAWGQACRPEFAGLRVATLALGTGVGFGLVDRGRILSGPNGEYPRINDVPTADGRSFEDLLGGAGLTPNPDPQQKADALVAGRQAVELVRSLYYPDAIVVGGGVGLSDWLDLGLPHAAWGHDAGLYGAAALALFPPVA